MPKTHIHSPTRHLTTTPTSNTYRTGSWTGLRTERTRWRREKNPIIPLPWTEPRSSSPLFQEISL